DCEVLVSVSAVPDPQESANAYFGIVEDADNALYFSAIMGALRCRLQENGSATTVSAAPYDPVAHKWWRIRETGGITGCETSPDGASWTVLAATPTPPFISFGFVHLAAGSYASVSFAGEARFDNVDLPP